MQRVLFNFLLAVEGVNANKLRSFLTALGIIFGVGAVIAMLAIGTGAKQAILDQMKLIGTNNIVIEAVVPETGDEISTENEEEEEKKPYSPGLSLADLASIQKTVPTVDRLSPEIILPVSVVRAGRQEKGRCIGVENAFFELNGLEIGQGIAFQPVHMEKGEAVCIIGTEVKKRFFSEEEPVGKLIKCGKTWLRVIGVLKKRNASEESLARLGIRDYNSDVYIPVSTALLRFRNRALITSDDLGNNDENKAKNYHQLDRLVVRVDDSKKLRASADVIARILQRRHLQVPDVEIEVPELLLEQEQQTQDTFNLVLAVIAGISLLVGGIGIMNIMLASVLERIKEIGVRRSLGATQLDIILQFLFEAVFISLIGGLIGVLLGVGAAKTIASYAEIPTIVSAWSILLSFGVAASIGLVFGLFPAQKAAKQDPIKALRSD
ncbi:MAG: ABC transporter permease [Phaeodactylibacter xiamenensis]|uniref:Membrane protein n=1 Tax=Phaeodactylibacter xiamenensis TaxID=1524460 RepID=A0A098S0K0_9BACT|nr:ABC transporter permease [Phaeodactylibacter xiamenensis]KGE85849.1 membrane protein [Phaeodactylibacter xiamenensis]MCR9054298.1 ABC transporter permease [bacterium]